MKTPVKPTSPTYVNKQVAVVDVATGAFKRYWGAYGSTDIDDDADDAYAQVNLVGVPRAGSLLNLPMTV